MQTIVKDKSSPQEAVDETIVIRLSQSKAEAAKQLNESGFNAGRQYADHRAKYAELRRLERWWRDNDVQTLEDSGSSGLAAVLAGGDGTSDEIIDLIRQSGGDDIEDGLWLEAFIAGALKRFKEIEAKL